MTEKDLIAKIKEKCERETHGWWIFKSKPTYQLTKTEPHFVVQTIEQLPNEYKSFQTFKPEIVLNSDGVMIREKFYPWSEILVTAIVNDHVSGSYLVLGLESGQLIDGYIGGQKMGDRVSFVDIPEFGHLVEFYKRKAKLNH